MMKDPRDDYDYDIQVGTFWSLVIVASVVTLMALVTVGLITLVSSG